MLGGVHDPLPPFETFPTDFFVTVWDMAPCVILMWFVFLGVSCCLQMLMEMGLSVKEWTRESSIPINRVYDVSELSIKKALVNFAIMNKVLQKLD